jgi:uncharacterized membrane protein
MTSIASTSAAGAAAVNAFVLLLGRCPLVFFHLVTAIGALGLGIALMLRRRGTPNHRLLGWTWAVLMGSTTLASAFMRSDPMLHWMGITPIHALTLLVALLLPRRIWQARRGNVVAHRRTMRGLFAGACVIAGAFTLLPGRFLGMLLWKNLLSVMA